MLSNPYLSVICLLPRFVWTWLVHYLAAEYPVDYGNRALGGADDNMQFKGKGRGSEREVKIHQ